MDGYLWRSMKKIFVLFMVLALVVSCKIAEVKNEVITTEPTSKLIEAEEGIFVEQYNYSPETRTYFFRHSRDIDYQALIGALLEIDGISNFVPAPYTMIITIAKSYTWDEVHPQIIGVLKNLGKFQNEGL